MRKLARTQTADGVTRRSVLLLQVFNFLKRFIFNLAVALKHVFERPVKICIEGIGPLGFCRKVAPVFVHPEPGRWAFSYIRSERVPACLCDLLMRHLASALDFGVEYEPVTSIWQGLAMRRNDRRAGLLM